VEWTRIALCLKAAESFAQSTRPCEDVDYSNLSLQFSFPNALMVDVMDPTKRSALMARIRRRDTKPERQLRSLLWRAGMRFRLHRKGLPGKPDIVLPKWKTVVFVHGCFWHAHANCRLFRLPATREDFWREKLESNRRRDARTVSELNLLSWRVGVVWECALREDPEATASQLLSWLQSDSSPTAEFCGIRGKVRKSKKTSVTH
jgi:DNA mismatch endonuclease (patch repair protein)